MDGSNVNLELYRIFYVTAKAGSLTKAAGQLFITQPAVTYSIHQLEQQLEGKLFFRTSKGVRLTAEGEMLLSYIEPAYQLILAGERNVADMHELKSGSMKIGASDTLCKYVLMPHLERFHQAYPAIKIQVTNRTTPETVKLLKEGAIDIGMVNLPVGDDRLVVRQGIAVQDIFVAGAAYASLAREEPLTMAELASYPILLLEKGSSTREYIDAYFSSHGVAVTPEIELGSIDLLVQFAKGGLGIACVIQPFIAEELDHQTLYEIKLQNPLPMRHIGVVSLRDVPLSYAARQFLAELGFGE